MQIWCFIVFLYDKLDVKNAYMYFKGDLTLRSIPLLHQHDRSSPRKTISTPREKTPRPHTIRPLVIYLSALQKTLQLLLAPALTMTIELIMILDKMEISR